MVILTRQKEPFLVVEIKLMREAYAKLVLLYYNTGIHCEYSSTIPTLSLSRYALTKSQYQFKSLTAWKFVRFQEWFWTSVTSFLYLNAYKSVNFLNLWCSFIDVFDSKYAVWFNAAVYMIFWNVFVKFLSLNVYVKLITQLTIDLYYIIAHNIAMHIASVWY